MLKIIYQQLGIFNTCPDEISIQGWDASMEHDVFMYAEAGDDSELLKRHIRAHVFKQSNNPNNGKTAQSARPGIRRRVDIKARNRKPRVNGASKPNFIGGSNMNKITCRRLRI